MSFSLRLCDRYSGAEDMAYEYKPEILCTDVTGYRAAMDRYTKGQATMAVSGGMTSAYRCSVSDNALIAAPTTYPTRDCANVEAALEILARGETCIVAAADMSALRARLLAEMVGQ